MPKIEKITFKRNYAINPLSHEHIHLGVEYILNEGEDPIAAFSAAQKLTDEFYLSNFKLEGHIAGVQLVADNKPVPEVTIQKTSKEQQIDNTIEAIKSCTSLKSAEIFRKLVERENNPSLTEAFDNKLKEFK